MTWSSTCTANDGCTLAFESSQPLPGYPPSVSMKSYDTCIVLLHGFSGSSAYFTRNLGKIGARFWTVAPDMRGHGQSGRTAGGYHVARLAADLRDVLAHLESSRPHSEPGTARPPLRVVPVGCSIGAAVVWTYLELFGDPAASAGAGAAVNFEFVGFVFVDQAPLQERSRFGPSAWDPSRAHKGCYDEASLAAAQAAWTAADRRPTHRALVAECLGYRFHPRVYDGVSPDQARRDEAFFAAISAQCDGTWLARLMADHTRYDHREAIELHVNKPTLVMAAMRSGCFTLMGLEEIVARVMSGGRVDKKDVRMAIYGSGHWLFYEEPERFNGDVIEFAAHCFGSG
ncbi:Alpha/Beta hydrolase protein [Lasiosphaeria miniovina]|uniref:Alpha/Beta hydrolase protein n=1 Tax=Lasiosphaeria miniovina TaxID=1954250 RepID=A0AA40AKU3_9PEZI|nr:Alpha/Beta hydrolase protein [Lasiosphaeria miniovina]KAK0717615.1 Alpha/Beta hydrolase protein [Lasiosphaeria miniovina]